MAQRRRRRKNDVERGTMLRRGRIEEKRDPRRVSLTLNHIEEEPLYKHEGLHTFESQ